ncbi:hypothetical protein HL658_04730 [Azospirillum sp. RWY-5-1]|uniref:Uncharacterized protein n=1 Tax=Azospirillum oleiclasticum TaxID=2735135 RepID=A0ABX2T3W3_9PROT|nr:hypothetical protein [Azospirillum oleiclasticum]NYZ11845.1 hypothetical protein [Azospirillum oleiclasticum]NYZ19005.1 hypothetical protein [Azospirillum oleiclasticum]
MRNSVRRFSVLTVVIGLLLAGATASPAHAQNGGESSFISADTVIIGCTAGGGASAFAAVLPLLTTAFGGAGVLVTPAVVGAWTGIGCAVGVVSGLIAIGTAWGMETWNQSLEADDAAT